jgi:carbamate kinase
MDVMQRSAVIAIGGNALINPGQQGTIDEQFANARHAARRVASLVVRDGWRVVVTHGNGPQVGFILLRSELAGSQIFTPRLTLDMCGADSQGGLGYILTNSLSGELARLGRPDGAACVLTQTVVDPADPAFDRPTKPIGGAYSKQAAEELRVRQGWVLAEDAGRGYRRLVASPRPLRIVESEAIRALLNAGLVVVAAGGGGIPVVETEPGVYRGVEAVIDKDPSSALLASSLGVPLLVITTGVERVAVRYRLPDQRFLDRLTLDEAHRYLATDEFPEGSMGPKIRAAIEFLEHGGKQVIITSLDCLEAAVAGSAGTHIV